jgi:hypothetical protein
VARDVPRPEGDQLTAVRRPSLYAHLEARHRSESFRLGLCAAAQRVITRSLDLVEVEAPEGCDEPQYGGGVTAAVGAETAVVAPAPFDAVTATSNLQPPSALVSVYVERFAPTTVQAVSVASQRLHA